MALNASYALRAASFSALLTGAGFAILLAKFSASRPLNTGVSLIGRAMVIFLYLLFKYKDTTNFRDIELKIRKIYYKNLLLAEAEDAGRAVEEVGAGSTGEVVHALFLDDGGVGGDDPAGGEFGGGTAP